VQDGSIFLNIVKLKRLLGDTFKLEIDVAEDVFAMGAMQFHCFSTLKKKMAIWILGGGVPKNYTLQGEPLLDQILNVRTDGFDIDVQFCVDPVDNGALSSCPAGEGHTWGKVSQESVQQGSVYCHCDVTAVFPWLTHALLSDPGLRKEPLALYEQLMPAINELQRQVDRQRTELAKTLTFHLPRPEAGPKKPRVAGGKTASPKAAPAKAASPKAAGKGASPKAAPAKAAGKGASSKAAPAKGAKAAVKSASAEAKGKGKGASRKHLRIMKKTALEQLASLRGDRVEEASGRVAQAQRGAAQAAARRASEEQARERLEASLQDETRAEGGRLAGGELRAADLAQEASRRIQTNLLRQRAVEATVRAAEAADQAQRAAAQALAALASARAEARVAEEAARRQKARLEASQLAKVEEESEDRFAARLALMTRG
jgi:hypothetical protein